MLQLFNKHYTKIKIGLYLVLSPILFINQDLAISLYGLIEMSYATFYNPNPNLIIAYWILYIAFIYSCQFYSNISAKLCILYLIHQTFILRKVKSYLSTLEYANIINAYHTMHEYYTNFNYDIFIYLNNQLIKRSEQNDKDQS